VILLNVLEQILEVGRPRIAFSHSTSLKLQLSLDIFNLDSELLILFINNLTLASKQIDGSDLDILLQVLLGFSIQDLQTINLEVTFLPTAENVRTLLLKPSFSLVL